MKIGRWLLGALLIALGIGATLWWTGRDQAGATQYRTVAVERGRLEAGVASSGIVNPVRQVQVGTQVSGQIVELLADFNTEVKKGQLIARIDAENFENKVRQSKADLDSAHAAVLTAKATVAASLAAVSKAQLDYDNAQRDASRKKDLLAKEFISQADYESTRNTAGTLGESLKATQAQVDVARAQVQSAEATVKQREASLAQSVVDRDRTQIRSPVDGIVIKRSVDVGQTVAASLQAPELFIIARNLSDMQVEVFIDEADIGRLRIGQPATFTVDAFPGRVYKGSVVQVRKAAINLQNVITYVAVVAFANEGAQLLPGMTASARIVTDEREGVLKVPNSALRMRIAGVADPMVSPASSAGSGSSHSNSAGLAQAQTQSQTQSQRQSEVPSRRVRAAADAEAAASASGSTPARTTSAGRVFVMDGDAGPVAVMVRLGVTDGTMTEVVSGPLEEGGQVVVGTIMPNATRSGGPRMTF